MSEFKSVGDNTIEFYDSQAKVALNHAPLDGIVSVPRAGDVVFLPAEMTGGENGLYDVQSVNYHYEPSEHNDITGNLGPVQLSRITVRVRKTR